MSGPEDSFPRETWGGGGGTVPLVGVVVGPLVVVGHPRLES